MNFCHLLGYKCRGWEDRTLLDEYSRQFSEMWTYIIEVQVMKFFIGDLARNDDLIHEELKSSLVRATKLSAYLHAELMTPVHFRYPGQRFLLSAISGALANLVRREGVTKSYAEIFAQKMRGIQAYTGASISSDDIQAATERRFSVLRKKRNRLLMNSVKEQRLVGPGALSIYVAGRSHFPLEEKKGDGKIPRSELGQHVAVVNMRQQGYSPS